MALPRFHWSQNGAAYFINRGTNGIASTMSSTNRANLDSDTTWASSLRADLTKAAVLLRLPGTVSIDKLGVRFLVYAPDYVGGRINIWGSTDSTSGLDGTWFSLVDSSTLPQWGVYTEYPCTPTQCSWIKIGNFDGNYSNTCEVQNIFVFGEQLQPNYEFWNDGMTTELKDSEYPLAFSPASTSSDFHQELRFRLKNLTASTHNYALTVAARKAGGDTVVTSNVKLSLDGGVTKSSTVNITNLTAGSFSGTISVFADILMASNPADGYHYLSIDVTES